MKKLRESIGNSLLPGWIIGWVQITKREADVGPYLDVNLGVQLQPNFIHSTPFHVLYNYQIYNSHALFNCTLMWVGMSDVHNYILPPLPLYHTRLLQLILESTTLHYISLFFSSTLLQCIFQSTALSFSFISTNMIIISSLHKITLPNNNSFQLIIHPHCTSIKLTSIYYSSLTHQMWSTIKENVSGVELMLSDTSESN